MLWILNKPRNIFNCVLLSTRDNLPRNLCIRTLRVIHYGAQHFTCLFPIHNLNLSKISFVTKDEWILNRMKELKKWQGKIRFKMEFKTTLSPFCKETFHFWELKTNSTCQRKCLSNKKFSGSLNAKQILEDSPYSP